MRLIETTNSHVVFKEVDNNGVLLNMQGFNYGSLHYQITNNRITFYPNDLDSPYLAEVWSVNLPVMVDGVPRDASDIDEALGAVMSDQWQEQITALQEDLAAETERSIAEDERINQELDDEEARALSAETFIYNYAQAVNTNLNNEINRSVSADSALNQAIVDETARAQGEEYRIEHKFDDEFQDLHDKDDELEQAIEDEEVRALSAETALHQEVLDEQARAISAETVLNGAIVTEVQRAEGQELILSGLISGETSRAQGIESALQASISAEVTRSSAEDVRLAQALSDEASRAVSAETTLTNAINAVDAKVDAEVLRSTAKDSEHDTLINGVTSDLSTEVARAQGIESALQASISSEVTRSTAEDSRLAQALNSEVTRATIAEDDLSQRVSANTSAITSEVTRSTAEDQRLNQALTNEITRATAAEGAIDTKADNNATAINAEVLRAQLAENTLSTTKANQSDLLALSGNSYTKAEVDAALAQKAEKASAFTSVEYNSNAKRIYFKANGVTVGEVNTTDFVVDGMVSDVRIQGGNLLIIFNSDSGHQTITIPLTDIFDPSNYYTKAETDLKLNGKQDVSGMSNYATTAYVQTVVTSVTSDTTAQIQTALAPVNDKIAAVSASTIVIDGKVNTLSGNVYTKSESDAKFIDEAELSAYTYDKYTIDTKISDAGVFDPTQYYTKQGVDERIASATTGKADTSAVTAHTSDTTIHVTSADKSAWNGKFDASAITAYSTTIEMGNAIDAATSGKADTSAVTSAINAATSGKADTSAVTTAIEAATSGKADVSAVTVMIETVTSGMPDNTEFNELSGKVDTLSGVVSGKQDTLSAGTGISISNNVISVTATSPTVDAYTKQEADAKFQAQSGMSGYATTSTTNAISGAVSSHTADSTVHVTSSEKASWNAKSNFSGSYNDLTDKPTIPTIWTGTQQQFDALTTKDPNCIYLVN